MNKPKIKIVFIFLLIALTLKTDYRLDTGIYCCKDDHDYYAHAETVAIDFDFDYSNQFEGNEDARFFYNNKSAPSAFFGSGLLASPFLFLGNILDLIFTTSELFNFKIMMYSFSSVFYLFFSFFLINKIKLILNSDVSSYLLYLFFLGTGISFYAFERYSMSHVYEAFTILLLIYLSLKFYLNKKKKKTNAFLIPIAVVLSVITRWVNVYALIIPLIVKLLTVNKSDKLSKYSVFWLSVGLSVGIFCAHSYLIYGVVTFNPELLYKTSGTLESFISSHTSTFSFMMTNFKNFFNILFTFEFGILWFSPIIFFSFYLTIKNTFLSENTVNTKLAYFLSMLCFAQIFSLVLLWKSTASSCGFRYVMNLAPLAIFLLLISKNISKVEIRYLKYMSLFSFFSTLFFETTSGTQLSLEYTYNSFGKFTKFTQPTYLTGYLNSLFEFEAYLKIFAQSFLGFFFFSIILEFLDIVEFTELLSKISSAAYNEDLQILLNKISRIEFYKVAFSVVIIYILCVFLIKNTNYENNRQ